jgi:excinuclease ABC subunit A
LKGEALKTIRLTGVDQNNLHSVDIEIPRNKLVVFTGVSGSGKSSLVYDVIYQEAKRKFLESFSSQARQYIGKLDRPDYEGIWGVSPSIAVDQKSMVRSPRSTVGTLSGINDLLRLLFARFSVTTQESGPKASRSLFSFNSPLGACTSCKGLGLEDWIDPDKIIADSNKTLREGAMVITTPTGYIIYSQVTMDVLNQVCESEGFNVDIPWNQLSEEQQHIVLNGSNKIKIPFGKHTLESRMKWSGITAKPREEGYYKGIIPVMEVILKRDRNPNIMRFVSSRVCSSCGGCRLKNEALDFQFRNKNIDWFYARSVEEIRTFFFSLSMTSEGERVIAAQILKLSNYLIDLGLSYLSLSRDSGSLSGGEAQRIRIATQLAAKLRGLTYIFDEPSLGLHPEENHKLIEILKQLRDNGNSVLVIEHDEAVMRAADHLIDVGPGAGNSGGEIVFQGNVNEQPASGITAEYLNKTRNLQRSKKSISGKEEIIVHKARYRNLKEIDVHFRKGCLNVVIGKSGSGRKTLVKDILARRIEYRRELSSEYCDNISGLEGTGRLIEIDQTPIGRTPRSNPATYTKVFDKIRDLYAGLPEAKKRGWSKGRFSFNVKDGRCNACEGAAYQQIGLHFLGNVEILCPECHGKRFKDDTLEVLYNGRSISEVLDMPVIEAISFFDEQPGIRVYLETLNELGLGYLSLGQSSTTISGGEAQRVKLASELVKKKGLNNIYILEEPTSGLHFYDIQILLDSISKLTDNGSTVIVIENDLNFIQLADHIVELGPGSGDFGGDQIARGTASELANSETSIIGKYLYPQSSGFRSNRFISDNEEAASIQLNKVSTNNLKGIDVEIPLYQLTVITGVSGSGKSSLAFDTLFNEGQFRYVENFSAYIRTLIGNSHTAQFESAKGIFPSIAINQRYTINNPRSTIGTFTEVYEYLRLLYSRVGESSGRSDRQVYSTIFSFNHQDGACSSCKGLGIHTLADPGKLVTSPEKSLLEGAISGSKPGLFYGDPYGQYVAILSTLGTEKGIDFKQPWISLSDEEKEIAMYGTGETKYDVLWKYKRKNREGEHRFISEWRGFTEYVNDEYERKHADKRAESMMPVMSDFLCKDCKGSRLKATALEYRIAGKNIAQLSELPVTKLHHFCHGLLTQSNIVGKENSGREKFLSIAEPVVRQIIERLSILIKLELGYLQLNRPSVSLSSGELQRVRLASMAGSGLTDVCFVLDEPTIGLHSLNTSKIIGVLNDLCANGNTVVVVEHDEEVIKAADHLIDIGPGAGTEGGRLLFSGPSAEIMNAKNSLTGRYLSGELSLRRNSGSRKLSDGIFVRGAMANNLKNIDLHIPAGGLVVLAGLSGSGKSSLLLEVLMPSLMADHPVNCQSVRSSEPFGQILYLNSLPIGRNPHSNLITYTGIFDLIRDQFAKTDSAVSCGLKKKDFSFNQKGGRCEVCQGMGAIKVNMDFLADFWQICEACEGKRYQNQVLSCVLNEKSIFDVLEMSVKDAAQFFEKSIIGEQLKILSEVGLAYLKLGQAGNTLSGGESQRLKLAKLLLKRKKERNLILLDEPSTGLHFHDVDQLMKLIDQLIEAGDSVIVIEHHPAFIANSDWIVELGPEGGDKGGLLVAEGSVNEIRLNSKSVTAKIL